MLLPFSRAFYFALLLAGVYASQPQPLLGDSRITPSGSQQPISGSGLTTVTQGPLRLTSSASGAIISSSGEVTEVKNNPAPEAIPAVTPEEASAIESLRDSAKESLILEIARKGSEFGGGWRLIPYDLSGIKKLMKFWISIEKMTSVLPPDQGHLYQREYGSPVFSSLQGTEKVWIINPNKTLTLFVAQRGQFLFDSEGVLIRAMNSAGEESAYGYLNEQLAVVYQDNGLTLLPEYEGKKVVSISGLPSKIYLEYDDRGFLRKIFDLQGAFLRFPYDGGSGIPLFFNNSGIIFLGRHSYNDIMKKRDGAVPLIFSDQGEVFYYKTPQNTWQFSYRCWDVEAND